MKPYSCDELQENKEPDITDEIILISANRNGTPRGGISLASVHSDLILHMPDALKQVMTSQRGVTGSVLDTYAVGVCSP